MFRTGAATRYQRLLGRLATPEYSNRLEGSERSGALPSITLVHGDPTFLSPSSPSGLVNSEVCAYRTIARRHARDEPSQSR